MHLCNDDPVEREPLKFDLSSSLLQTIFTSYSLRTPTISNTHLPLLSISARYFSPIFVGYRAASHTIFVCSIFYFKEGA
jgi:hypothetical protein